MPNVKSACCDTSFLISFYGNDVKSRNATDFVSSFRGHITLSSLNCYELEQSLHFLVWRKILSPVYRETLQKAFAADCLSGAMQVVPCSLGNVLARAQRLSALYTEVAGHRSMDILIVANALELGVEYFLSFDINQRKLAKAEGLKLNP
jgi:predicted nucleic acid-binding protein